MDEIITGKCKFFAVHRGYGFIIGDDRREYFAHVKEMIDIPMHKGDTVEFTPTLQMDENGKQSFI